MIGCISRNNTSNLTELEDCDPTEQNRLKLHPRGVARIIIIILLKKIPVYTYKVAVYVKHVLLRKTLLLVAQCSQTNQINVQTLRKKKPGSAEQLVWHALLGKLNYWK